MNSCLIGLVLFLGTKVQKIHKTRSYALSHGLFLMYHFYGYTIIAALHEQQYGSPAHNDYVTAVLPPRPCRGPHAK